MYILSIIVYVLSLILLAVSNGIFVGTIIGPFSLRERILAGFLLLVCFCGAIASTMWAANECHKIHPYATVIRTNEIVTPKRIIQTKDDKSDTTYVYTFSMSDLNRAAIIEELKEEN